MTTVPAAALDQHIAILGKTGSGKTFAAKGIVERLLGQRRQVCVLDPTAAWWGLRLDANGKGRGYDVVLIGGKPALFAQHLETILMAARLAGLSINPPEIDPCKQHLSGTAAAAALGFQGRDKLKPSSSQTPEPSSASS